MGTGVGRDHVDLLIRVGTSGWSYPSWVGPFYPPKTSAARMLSTYAQTFTTVEAHSTHRRLPTSAAVERWAASVPPGFHFAPKAHAGITHRRATDGLEERFTALHAALAPLGDRLGPVLYVLPHRQPDLDRLDALLAGLRGPNAVTGLRGPNAVTGLRGPAGAVFELAPPWRVEPVFERLEAAGASLAVVDREDDPGLDQPVLGPVAYFRLRRATYDDADLDRWAERLAAEGAERPVYAFVKHDEEGDGPRYAQGLVTRLEQG